MSKETTSGVRRYESGELSTRPPPNKKRTKSEAPPPPVLPIPIVSNVGWGPDTRAPEVLALRLFAPETRLVYMSVLMEHAEAREDGDSGEGLDGLERTRYVEELGHCRALRIGLRSYVEQLRFLLSRLGSAHLKAASQGRLKNGDQPTKRELPPGVPTEFLIGPVEASSDELLSIGCSRALIALERLLTVADGVADQLESGVLTCSAVELVDTFISEFDGCGLAVMWYFTATAHRSRLSKSGKERKDEKLQLAEQLLAFLKRERLSEPGDDGLLRAAKEMGVKAKERRKSSAMQDVQKPPKEKDPPSPLSTMYRILKDAKALSAMSGEKWGAWADDVEKPRVKAPGRRPRT